MQSSENVRVFEIFNPGRSILSLRNTFSNFMSKHQVERENAYTIYSAPEKDEQKFLHFTHALLALLFYNFLQTIQCLDEKEENLLHNEKMKLELGCKQL